MGMVSKNIGDAFQGTQASNPFGIGGGNFNMLPVDMQGNYLTGNEPSTPQVGVGSGGMPPGDAGVGFEQPMLPPGQGMPGMGGKIGGGNNIPGAVIDQPMLPPPGNYMGGIGGIDPMPMPMPEPTSMAGLPPAPNAQIPLGRVSGGTLGRPSASAPMVPRGPGANNPGAPGNPPPQPPERGMLTPPQGLQNRLQPAPATPAAPIVSQRARVPRQAPQSMKGGMARGAGRGGLLR
jgi:hypothetical protein